MIHLARLRIADLLGALSLAADPSMGLPAERTVRSCYIGMYLAERLQLLPDQPVLYLSEAGGTRVTFLAEYTVPVPLLGRLAEAVIVKVNEHEAEALLANLKVRMEA